MESFAYIDASPIASRGIDDGADVEITVRSGSCSRSRSLSFLASRILTRSRTHRRFCASSQRARSDNQSDRYDSASSARAYVLLFFTAACGTASPNARARSNARASTGATDGAEPASRDVARPRPPRGVEAKKEALICASYPSSPNLRRCATSRAMSEALNARA